MTPEHPILTLARARCVETGFAVTVEKDGKRTRHIFWDRLARDDFRLRHANAVASGRYDAIGGAGRIVCVEG